MIILEIKVVLHCRLLVSFPCDSVMKTYNIMARMAIIWNLAVRCARKGPTQRRLRVVAKHAQDFHGHTKDLIDVHTLVLTRLLWHTSWFQF
jgi:hypothetical protein